MAGRDYQCPKCAYFKRASGHFRYSEGAKTGGWWRCANQRNQTCDYPEWHRDLQQLEFLNNSAEHPVRPPKAFYNDWHIVKQALLKKQQQLDQPCTSSSPDFASEHQEAIVAGPDKDSLAAATIYSDVLVDKEDAAVLERQNLSTPQPNDLLQNPTVTRLPSTHTVDPITIAATVIPIGPTANVIPIGPTSTVIPIVPTPTVTVTPSPVVLPQSTTVVPILPMASVFHEPLAEVLGSTNELVDAHLMTPTVAQTSIVADVESTPVPTDSNSDRDRLGDSTKITTGSEAAEGSTGLMTPFGSPLKQSQVFVAPALGESNVPTPSMTDRPHNKTVCSVPLQAIVEAKSTSARRQSEDVMEPIGLEVSERAVGALTLAAGQAPTTSPKTTIVKKRGRKPKSTAAATVAVTECSGTEKCASVSAPVVPCKKARLSAGSDSECGSAESIADTIEQVLANMSSGTEDDVGIQDGSIAKPKSGDAALSCGQKQSVTLDTEREVEPAVCKGNSNSKQKGAVGTNAHQTTTANDVTQKAVESPSKSANQPSMLSLLDEFLHEETESAAVASSQPITEQKSRSSQPISEQHNVVITGVRTESDAAFVPVSKSASKAAQPSGRVPTPSVSVPKSNGSSSKMSAAANDSRLAAVMSLGAKGRAKTWTAPQLSRVNVRGKATGARVATVLPHAAQQKEHVDSSTTSSPTQIASRLSAGTGSYADLRPKSTALPGFLAERQLNNVKLTNHSTSDKANDAADSPLVPVQQSLSIMRNPPMKGSNLVASIVQKKIQELQQKLMTNPSRSQSRTSSYGTPTGNATPTQSQARYTTDAFGTPILMHDSDVGPVSHVTGVDSSCSSTASSHHNLTCTSQSALVNESFGYIAHNTTAPMFSHLEDDFDMYDL